MYKIDVELEGVAPFLFNRMTEINLAGLAGAGTSGGVIGEDARIAEGHAKAYRNTDGSLYLPAWNIKRALLDGCIVSKLKEGKTRLFGLVSATVFVEAEGQFDEESAKRIALHEVPGKIPPRKGAAAIIRRPMLPTGWRLRFKLGVVDDRRSPDLLRRALDEGGMLAGIGSWRPHYGRFKVIRWEVAGRGVEPEAPIKAKPKKK